MFGPENKFQTFRAGTLVTKSVILYQHLYFALWDNFIESVSIYAGNTTSSLVKLFSLLKWVLDLFDRLGVSYYLLLYGFVMFLIKINNIKFKYCITCLIGIKNSATDRSIFGLSNESKVFKSKRVYALLILQMAHSRYSVN